MAHFALRCEVQHLVCGTQTVPNPPPRERRLAWSSERYRGDRVDNIQDARTTV